MLQCFRCLCENRLLTERRDWTLKSLTAVQTWSGLQWHNIHTKLDYTSSPLSLYLSPCKTCRRTDKIGALYVRFVHTSRIRRFKTTFQIHINHLTPNGHYMGRTTQLTSRCCILYIYSTNIRTKYFKHAA